jgi:hypothetical protein
MAQAVKKKLVVCGGNGFLGTLSPWLLYKKTYKLRSLANTSQEPVFVKLLLIADGLSRRYRA